jgi:hypothetical protein
MPEYDANSEPSERSGGTVPIEQWDEVTETVPSAGISSGRADQNSDAGTSTWRRSLVVLTTADADTSMAGK